MIAVLDSTLREGEQTTGVYFSKHIKLAIAEYLEQIGIDYIEAGHPVVSEDITDFIKKLVQRKSGSLICAHSRSLRKDIDLALECGVDFIGFFYCITDRRMKEIFNTDLNQVINQVTDTIKYVKDKNSNTILRFTPEDSVRTDKENIIKIAVEAARAGADIISIADTTGYMIPGTDRNMYDYITMIRHELSEEKLHPKIEVHCHNDRGLALANAIDAYRAGVDIIDASVMGLGERAGILDLAQLLVVLKEDFKVKNNWNLKLIPELYEMVSRHSGIDIQKNFPVTGKYAFSHCAGIHAQAAIINPVHYQSLDPEIIGRKSEIVLGHMSGYSAVKYALKQIGEDGLDEALINKILKKVKEIGHTGRNIEYNELREIVKWCKLN